MRLCLPCSQDAQNTTSPARQIIREQSSQPTLILSININMSFNGAPPGSDSVTNRNLEAQLRGMILSNDQTRTPHEPGPEQRPGSSHIVPPYLHKQSVPFFGMPGNTAGPVGGFNQLLHSTAQTSGLSPTLPPVTQGLPPPGFFSPRGDSTNLPTPYQTYPGPSPPALQTAGLPPQPGSRYSPSQRSVPQSQSPNISPNTPPHQDYMPPHMRHIYRHQPTSPQNILPPARQPPPAQQPQTPSQRRSRNHQFNSPQNISRVPPATALDHFPPLGAAIQPDKTNTSLSNLYHQQPIAPKRQQRTQYQPLQINTRNYDPPARGGGPVRGNFRSPSHSSRPSQQYIEQISAEQSYYLNDFSKRIIAEAAPPASETSVKDALLKRLGAICKEISPDASLIPFGSLVSECTQLFLQTSPVFLKRVFRNEGHTTPRHK